MKRTISLLLAVSACFMGVAAFASIGSAAVPSVQFNGNTYYQVDGNNPAMDTGKEVCASMGKQCLGYKSVNTNSICKLFHPTAKELVSVNGSKAGFYCNGAPQQGLACAPYKNTCEVCPACNLNEAATCDQPIGQHFKEMYVWCGSAGSAMTPSPMYGALPMPKVNLLSDPNNCGRAGNKCPVGAVCTNGVCARRITPPAPAPASNSVTCTFSNTPLKKVTCTAYKAGDTFCAIAMQSTQAKAVICNNQTVSCTLPCSAPFAYNLRQCAYGGVKSGNCPAPAVVAPAAGKKTAGQQCQHGGDCQSGMCLGVVPGQYYVCSCIDPTTRWQSCNK